VFNYSPKINSLVMDFRGFTPVIFSNRSDYSSKLGRINPTHPINR